MKPTKYSDLSISQITLLIENMQPRFKNGTLSQEEQQNYLYLRREAFIRSQTKLQTDNQITLL